MSAPGTKPTSFGHGDVSASGGKADMTRTYGLSTNAPAANLDLPGAAILAAMNTSADIFGSRLAGQPKHTDEGYKFLIGCLTSAPTHWPDITIHYYCQMSKPRACYTYALSGKSTGARLPRPKAYQGCAAGVLPNSLARSIRDLGIAEAHFTQRAQGNLPGTTARLSWRVACTDVFG